MRRLLVTITLMLSAVPAIAQDILRGHGGPVRAMAVRPEARELVSGSFDSTVIVWDTARNTARRVLRFHAGPVNAVTILPGGCLASAGEDRRIAIWCGAADVPARVLEGHEAPVTSLSEAGGRLYSGSFDATVRTWDYRTGAALGTATTHSAAVSAVARLGSQWAWGGADGALGVGSQETGSQRSGLPAPVTALASAGDEIVAAGSDGQLRIVGPEGVTATIEVEGIPLASLAVSPDGKLIATAGLRGGIAIVDRHQRRIFHRLTGPGLPVWSLAFDSDSRTLFSGGADRVIRRWDAVEGRAISSALPERDPVAEAVASGERGAVVFRACQACHTLTPDDGNRAGPTLHGVFGRRIGSAAGYVYSPALPRLDIVWTKETIARLFEIGPTAYTPGTKMPEQTIADPADRHALVEWLERVTAAR